MYSNNHKNAKFEKKNERVNRKVRRVKKDKRKEKYIGQKHLIKK